MSEIEVAAPEPAEQIERFSREGVCTQLSFRGGKPLAAHVSANRGQAVRVVAGGRLGVASRTGSADASSDERLLARARAAAEAGEAPGFTFAPAGETGPGPAIFDEATAALGPRDLQRLGAAIVEQVRAVAPDVSVDLDLAARVATTRLEASSGARAEERESAFSASLALSLALADDLVNVYADGFGRAPDGVLEAASRRALGWLEPARRRVRAARRTMRVAFAPEAVAALLDPFVQALDGLEAALGISPLAASEGEAVLDARLTLADDGVAADGPASRRWDGEGVARQRTELVARGTLRSFFHDRRSAARLGVESTGNAVRDDLLPRRGPTNWRLEAEAALGRSDLLRELGEGLLVVELLGIGQTATRDGSFANPIALGFAVAGGEILGRVTDATVSGNAFELLRARLVAAGDDGLWTARLGFPLWTPTLLLDAVSVTAG